MYQYILFDLDGTLTDPKEGITRCVQYALKHFGIDEPDPNALTHFIGPPLVQSFREFYGFDEQKAKQAVEKYRERFNTIGIFENGAFEGVHEMLDALKKHGKVVALATSKPEVHALRILEKYQLIAFFDCIVGSELDGTRSEKAEVILEVFRRLKLSPEQQQQALMVGDRKFDILGAKACGIHSVGVRFGYAEENELEQAGADYIVDTVEALTRFLVSH